MITTVTTVTAVATMGIAEALGIAAAVSLIVFLTAKELVGATHSSSSLRIAKFANVGIVPLIIAFAVILATQIFGLPA